MHDLTSTAGIVAIAAAAVAAVSLLTSIVLAVRLRRVRADQRLLLDAGDEDIVAHVAALARQFTALHDYVADIAERLDQRVTHTEDRLEGTVAYHALVRYDAYGEMSGHQSTSLALLDADHNGVVLSSIAHRDTARLYCKQVHGGRGEHQLSPEEEEAVRLALAGEVGSVTLGQ